MVLSVEEVAICCSYLLKSIERISLWVKICVLHGHDEWKYLAWEEYGPKV